MKGFDPKWKDFPDYILGITHEIWEERGVDTLNDYYSADIPVRSPEGLVIGNKDVIAATKATLEEFPDRQLLGEDVIWCGDPERGMLSSHRILSTATHTGDGAYGRATGRRLQYRVIAECHAIGNQINDEWLIRDQGAIARQLGIEARDFAQRQIEAQGGHNSAKRPYTPAMNVPGPYSGKGNEDPWGARLADILVSIAAGQSDVIDAAYDRAACLHYPGGSEGHSHADARAFWTGLRGSFPDAAFSIDHQIGREDPLMPPRAAVRWAMHGSHSGEGMFGVPTGADVYIMGATHAEFGPWGLRREYTLFDETMVWKQILLGGA